MPTPSEELQRAVYQALLLDNEVSAVVGSRVYDGRIGKREYPCVSFGPSDWQPDDMDGVSMRIESLQIDCWAQSGKWLRPAKALRDKVSAALHLKTLALNDHALALLRVERTTAFMDADGLTGHGIVTLEAQIEVR